MANSKTLKVVVAKLVVYSYIIPGAIIYFIFKGVGAPWNSTLTFLFAYLMLTSVINFCILKKSFDAEENSSNDVENNKPETPTPEIKDDPPSYSEVTKDPPPYSVLMYYKRIMKKTPFVRRNNSLEKSNRNISGEPSGTQVKPGLKRNQSSPN